MRALRSVIGRPLLDAAEVDELIQQVRSHQQTDRRSAPRLGAAGSRVSPILGGGLDFADPRPYHPGDDIRRIDWRSSARARLTLIRPVHAELDQSSAVLIDLRPPMRFGTRQRLKAAQALRAAIWSVAAREQSPTPISLSILSEQCRWLEQLTPPQALQALRELAAKPCPPTEPQASAFAWRRIFATLQGRLTEGSDLLLISDFHQLEEDASGALNALGHRINVTAVHIQDASELHPDRISGAEWRWGKAKRRMNTDLDDRRINEAAAKQQDRTNRLFRRAGVNSTTLLAEQNDLSLWEIRAT